jgi:hypothetical protein
VDINMTDDGVLAEFRASEALLDRPFGRDPPCTPPLSPGIRA